MWDPILKALDKTKLEAIADLFVESDEYDSTTVRNQLLAFAQFSANQKRLSSGAYVESIYFNDPRMWAGGSLVTAPGFEALNGLVEKTSLTPAQQQVALLAASVQNQCHFCSVAHRAIGKLKQVRQQSLDAIHAGARVEDPQDAALAGFTQAVVENRGRPGEAAIQAFLEAGFTKQQILEVMLIVSIKTLSNYINHLTNPEPNPELLSVIGESAVAA